MSKQKLRMIHNWRGLKREVLCDAPLFAVERLVGDEDSESVRLVPFCQRCDFVVDITDVAVMAYNPHEK